MSLAKLLTQKIESEGLSLAQAAEKVGVSLPSLRSVAAGKAVPNSRSLDKYANFLGVSSDEVREAAGSRGGKAKKSKGKAKAAVKGKRGPGRPPGSGKKRGRPPGSGKKRGRPPGSGKKRGRPPGSKNASVGGANAALAAIVAALAASEALTSDTLAIQVHNLDGKQRSLIESILATF